MGIKQLRFTLVTLLQKINHNAKIKLKRAHYIKSHSSKSEIDGGCNH